MQMTWVGPSRHYVLVPALPFCQIQHGEAETLPQCQCYLWRVALADTHGAADLLGNDYPAKVVDPPHDSCCFHISNLLILMKLCLVFGLSGNLSKQSVGRFFSEWYVIFRVFWKNILRIVRFAVRAILLLPPLRRRKPPAPISEWSWWLFLYVIAYGNRFMRKSYLAKKR